MMLKPSLLHWDFFTSFSPLFLTEFSSIWHCIHNWTSTATVVYHVRGTPIFSLRREWKWRLLSVYTFLWCLTELKTMKTAFAPILSTLKWYKQAKLPRLTRDAFLQWQGIAYLEIRLCSIAQGKEPTQKQFLITEVMWKEDQSGTL